MKNFIILYFILASSVFCQDRGGYFEIYTHTTGQSGSGPIQFWMESEGAVWDWDHSTSQTNQRLIDSYNLARACFINNENSTDVPVPNNGYNYGIYSALTYTTTPDRNYGYGLYKFCIGYQYGNPVIYFYLDWRDCDYSDYYNYNDTWVLFDATNNTAKIDWNDDDFTDEVTNVQNGAVYKIWREKSKSIRQNIQNTNYLELYLNVTNQNGNPYLSWNAYHDANILGYNIYRKITLGAGGSQTDAIFTTSTTYLDDDFEIDPKFGDDQVEYWIKAKISSPQESLNGNHVQLTGDSFIQWKLANQETSMDLDYKLSQNYPNPFNPITRINYSIKEKGFLQLKVYDVLGKEITTLVNEEKQQGDYSVFFNGSNLPSGVYVYSIRVNNFIQNRKMILMK